MVQPTTDGKLEISTQDATGVTFLFAGGRLRKSSARILATLPERRYEVEVHSRDSSSSWGGNLTPDKLQEGVYQDVKMLGRGKVIIKYIN